MLRASPAVVSLLVSVLVASGGGKPEKKGVQVIEVPRTSGVSPFGEQGAGGTETTAAYYGQTFTVPTTGLAQDITFELLRGPDEQGTDDVHFRLLITTVTGTGTTLNPGDVLFESGTLTLDHDAPDWQTFTVPLGQLPLTGGSVYYWILDSWADFNGITGTAQVGGSNCCYPGEFYTGSAGAANWPTDPGTREDHFEQFQRPFAEFDLAFRLTYVETKAKKPR